jgi:cell division protein FtsB
MELLLRRSFWVPLALVTAISMLASLALMQRRAAIRDLRRRQAALARANERLDAENRALSTRERLLMTDQDVEQVARDHYGFAAPQENVEAYQPPPERAAGATEPSREGDRWDRLLGSGGFPWRLPLMVFSVSAFVLALLACAEAGSERTDESRRHGGARAGRVPAGSGVSSRMAG